MEQIFLVWRIPSGNEVKLKDKSSKIQENKTREPMELESKV